MFSGLGWGGSDCEIARHRALAGAAERVQRTAKTKPRRRHQREWRIRRSSGKTVHESFLRSGHAGTHPSASEAAREASRLR